MVRFLVCLIPFAALCQPVHRPPPRTPERTVHFVAAATSTTGDDASSTGAVYIFERESLRQLGRIELPGGAHGMARVAGNPWLYVGIGGRAPGIAVVDLSTMSLGGTIALPGADGRLLAAGGQILAFGAGAAGQSTVTAIDAATGAMAGSADCPGFVEQYGYDRFDGTLFGASIDRAGLCAIGPGLLPSPGPALPLGPHPNFEAVAALDNGAEGLLVVTYTDMADPNARYRSVAVDLRGRAARTYPLPELDGVFLSQAGDRVYAIAAGGVQRYDLSFAADGTPHFAAAPGLLPAAALAPRDERYLYPGIAGACANPEGQPLPCIAGFQVWEIATLAPRAENASVVLGQRVSSVMPGVYAAAK